MNERTRWRIARLLDRSRRFCWADLVTWALGWDTTLRDAHDRVRECANTEAQPFGHCYCNKFNRETAA